VTVRVVVLPDAVRQIEEADAWWRANRPAAPDLLGRELAGAFARLEQRPEIGRAFPRPGFPGLRVLLLRRTRYHVYYDRVADEVVIRAFWSAVRRRRARLRRA
jgi:plasmid stabilization system protein ParE